MTVLKNSNISLTQQDIDRDDAEFEGSVRDAELRFLSQVREDNARRSREIELAQLIYHLKENLNNNDFSKALVLISVLQEKGQIDFDCDFYDKLNDIRKRLEEKLGLNHLELN